VGPGACADSGSSGLLFNTAVDQSEAASSESGRRRHEEAKQAHMARAESGDNSAAGGAGVYLVFDTFKLKLVSTENIPDPVPLARTFLNHRFLPASKGQKPTDVSRATPTQPIASLNSS
jgi:hypothetical protein